MWPIFKVCLKLKVCFKNLTNFIELQCGFCFMFCFLVHEAYGIFALQPGTEPELPA